MKCPHCSRDITDAAPRSTARADFDAWIDSALTKSDPTADILGVEPEPQDEK